MANPTLDYLFGVSKYMKYIFTELLAPVDRRAARTVRSESALQPLRHLENELVKASKMPNLNG